MIKIKKTKEDSKIPIKAYESDAGYDLFNNEETFKLKPGDIKDVKTGVIIQLPNLGSQYDVYGRIAPKSGLAINYGIDVLGGVIDRDYTGEITVILINHGKKTITIEHGDKIAQYIPTLIYNTPIKEIKVIKNTLRGDDKYGSTGK